MVKSGMTDDASDRLNNSATAKTLHAKAESTGATPAASVRGATRRSHRR